MNNCCCALKASLNESSGLNECELELLDNFLRALQTDQFRRGECLLQMKSQHRFSSPPLEKLDASE